ncbi:MAG: transketolase, partial [Candidatus Aminicenantes bacterium]|nr:transketolase [Candidatus Aminicenantes bacterium]
APTKQDSASAHGSPLGDEEVRGAKKFYGWDPEKKFFVPDAVRDYGQRIRARGARQNREWDELFARYTAAYPEPAAQLRLLQNRELPDGWEDAIPSFTPGTKISGRAASSSVLNAIAERIPVMIGGCADLAPSTLAVIKNSPGFQKDNRGGRNLHYGVREHAMGAVANGISLSGLRTFVSTFFVFSDYMRPAMRMSALMKQPVIYIFTHDSIGVGEDGPTHQPIEHLASLRTMPNLEVIRPADANEVAFAWKYIMETGSSPTALVLSRQDLPVFDRSQYASAAGTLKGGYVLADSDGVPDVILIASGSEVQLALAALEELKKEGIGARVVSMPNWSLFDRQGADYREMVLPAKVARRIAIEAGSTFGWSHFLGPNAEGRALGLKTFGASGKPDSLFSYFGLTKEALVKAVKELLQLVRP